MFADMLSSLYRHSSTADLAMLATTSPDVSAVRAVAREAGDRSPQAAKVLSALADRLTRTMRDLSALERQQRETVAQPALAPAAPAKRGRKPRAVAGDASLLPMPDSWGDLSDAQRAWFAENEPFAWANVERKGRCANDRSPAQLHAHHLHKAKSKWHRRGTWEERFARETAKAAKLNAEIAARCSAMGCRPVPDMRVQSRQQQEVQMAARESLESIIDRTPNVDRASNVDRNNEARTRRKVRILANYLTTPFLAGRIAEVETISDRDMLIVVDDTVMRVPLHAVENCEE